MLALVWTTRRQYFIRTLYFIRYTLYFQALTTSGQRMNSQCGMPCPDRYDVAECPDIRVKWEEGVSENCDQTRRWVACAGGVLKEVFKTESTCLADDNCAKQSCSSSAGLKERQFDAITSVADDPRIDVEQLDDINNSIIPVFLAQPVQDPGSLGTHILLHTCDLCSQIFSSSGSLQHHATLHIDDRPYNCRLCGKSFAQAVNLRIHERSHSGAKPYPCPTCSRSFATSSYLKEHSISHTGVKSHSCSRCGKSFTNLSNRTRHERMFCKR